MTTLKGKTALVTGSARGLGAAIAIRFAELGANIIVNYSKDKEAADKTVESIKQLGVKVTSIKADVSKVSDIELLFETAVKEFKQIDIVVANAGIELLDIPVTEFTEEHFDHLFTINTKGTYFTIQQAAKNVADNGRIIYIASSTTSFPFAGVAIYGGSKTAPRYLVEVLAKEIGYRGVCVNSIIPYAIDKAGVFTDPKAYPGYRKSLSEANPMGRLGLVEDVANVAEFLAGGLSSFVNGQHILVNGGAAG